MNSVLESNCPLCNAKANFTGVDYGRRKTYSCPNCSNFQITLSAEKYLATAPKKWREGCSVKAKATPDGKLLAIIVPDRHKNEGSNSAAISAEYHLISELP